MAVPSIEELGVQIGKLVAEKNRAYGSSFDDAGAFMRLLYPDGIQPEQYEDMLGIVRVWDKLKRIATDRDALGESPWFDVAGYGLLGARRVLALKETNPQYTAISGPASKPERIKSRVVG